MQRFTRTLLFTAALTAAPLALANPDGHHPPGGFDAAPIHHLAGAIKRLDLSEEQRDAIRGLFDENKEDLRANAKASRKLRKEIQSLMAADSLDEEALADAARREGQLAEERVLLTGTLTSKVLGQLDDAQRAELKTMHEERQDRRRERGGERD